MTQEQIKQAEQEARQAQTVAEIKDRIERYGKDSSLLILAMPKALALLKIVDSQAQKIAEQAKEIDALKVRIAGLYAYIDEAQAVK